MVNRSLACLRRMLRIAQADNKIPFVPKVHLLKEPAPRRGFLEPAKFAELVALLPTHLRPLVTFLYWCGVRVGEAKQIQWHQVDLAAKVIRLESEQTKNAEGRVVPLPSIVVMMLREMKPKTGHVFDDTNLRTEWEKACDACGLGTRKKVEPTSEDGFPWYSYKGLLVHDLRRSAVRNLRRAGVSETVIMGISGHKTAEVFRRYNIVSTTDKVDAMRQLELSSDSWVIVAPKAGRRLPSSRSK
jgi:integrase